jgi:hypothetical protein
VPGTRRPARCLGSTLDGRRGRCRRGSVVCALAVAAALAAALAAAPAVADPTYPELDVYTYDQTPGDATDIDLDVVLVHGAPAVGSIALTLPAGYRITGRQFGAQLGRAEVEVMPAAGGAVSTLKGTIVTADPATLAADPQVQLCAPGTHASAWRLVVSGSASVTIPVVVDPLAGGGSFRIVACLAALRGASLKPVDVYLETRDVFRNPAGAGTYTWSALVTPFDAAGAPDATGAFEVLGDEPLPETLSAKPVYSVKTKTLTVSGTLLAAHEPRVGIRVHIFGGASASGDKKELGVAATTGSGAYTFRKRLATAPRYVYSEVHFYISTRCRQPSTAPAGCASQSIDGTDSRTTKVTDRS